MRSLDRNNIDGSIEAVKSEYEKLLFEREEKLAKANYSLHNSQVAVGRAEKALKEARENEERFNEVLETWRGSVMFRPLEGSEKVVETKIKKMETAVNKALMGWSNF